MSLHPNSKRLQFWSKRSVYKRPEKVIWVPASVITTTVSFLCEYEELEAGCYWYGTRDVQGNGVVAAVVVPHQQNSWGNYHVPAESISQVSDVTRPHGWFCLAQVHSHPGSTISHSQYDDRRAGSDKILSVVFPNYGRWNASWPEMVGVHEFQNGDWHELSIEDARARVQLQTANSKTEVIDLRHES